MTAMRRAIAVRAAGTWPADQAVDRLVLPYEARHRRRFRFRAAGGLDVLLDLAQAVVLADGDGLELDGGGVVLVQAAAESLIEVRAAAPGALARYAYHLGNRHLEVQLLDDRLLIRFDPVIEDMLRGLGADVRTVAAPFTPEPGAYDGQGGHGHHHGAGHHDHRHGHDHGVHDYGAHDHGVHDHGAPGHGH